jgi:hypothetical protein
MEDDEKTGLMAQGEAKGYEAQRYGESQER